MEAPSTIGQAQVRRRAAQHRLPVLISDSSTELLASQEKTAICCGFLEGDYHMVDKPVKVEKTIFDAVLRKMISTPTVPREKLKGKKKLARILTPIKPASTR